MHEPPEPVWDQLRRDFQEHSEAQAALRATRQRKAARLARRGRVLRGVDVALGVLAAAAALLSVSISNDDLWRRLPILFPFDAFVLVFASHRFRAPLWSALGWLLGGVPAAVALLGALELAGLDHLSRLFVADGLLSLWYHAPFFFGAAWAASAVFGEAALPALDALDDRLAASRARAEAPGLERALDAGLDAHFDDIATFVERRLANSIRVHRHTTEAAARAARDQLGTLDASLAAAVSLARDADHERATLDAEAAPARARLVALVQHTEALLQEAARAEATLRERFRDLAARKAELDREQRAAEASRRARAAIRASDAAAHAVGAEVVDGTAALQREVGALLQLLQAGAQAVAAAREVAALGPDAPLTPRGRAGR